MALPEYLSEIVAEWLSTHGYDGLCNDGGCACLLGDLMPCDAPLADCQPGVEVPPHGADAQFRVESGHPPHPAPRIAKGEE